jgi:hypothetical protein
LQGAAPPRGLFGRRTLDGVDQGAYVRAAHPDVFAGRQHVDYAEVLGQVRVKMDD